MNFYIAIDDTDNIGTAGTGEILENLIVELSDKFETSFSRVTRHQLLVHKDIKYTSHNSSMCSSAFVDTSIIPFIIDHSIEFLTKNCAEGSDPGLCIVDIDKVNDNGVEKIKKWGSDAKRNVLCKKDAYLLAKETGIHLSEHGGTGDGIIGALAGIGLRLSGNDGRFKGKFDLDVKNGFIKVRDILLSPSIDIVTTECGSKLSPDDEVFITDKLKTILKDHKSVLMIRKNKEGHWENLSRKELKVY
ncbi:MAG: hypothetical protein JXR69_07600 [Candidatus Delongbacteria bacterium]|nr:hypothetical protein [Candidatus Delongbacteria bacterium]